MSQAWEKLGEAVQDEQYLKAASVLAHELHFESPNELVPFLQKTLTTVIDFTSTKEGEESVVDTANTESACVKRWRKTVRGMFNAEAAVAMLCELEFEYAKPEWPPYFYARLEPEMKPADKMKVLSEMCAQEVMSPVIERYGFEQGPSGAEEVNTVVKALAEKNPLVKSKFANVTASFSKLMRLSAKGS
mmetsp:Transcript_52882/g.113349  ORF Transcript_52882/g.113349 Transcript_52882/m.113349 type:complete len:189 (+) Transcript_52882:91-657(+)